MFSVKIRYIFWAQSSSLSEVNINKNHKSLSDLSTATTAINVCVSIWKYSMNGFCFLSTKECIQLFYRSGVKCFDSQCLFFCGCRWIQHIHFLNERATVLSLIPSRGTCYGSLSPQHLPKPGVLPFPILGFPGLFFSPPFLFFFFFSNYHRYLLAQMVQSCMKIRF